MFRKVDRDKPRAVLLGGGRSALEVARCLGAEGVEVFTICAPDDVTVHSRFVTPIVFPNDGDYQAEVCERGFGRIGGIQRANYRSTMLQIRAVGVDRVGCGARVPLAQPVRGVPASDSRGDCRGNERLR